MDYARGGMKGGAKDPSEQADRIEDDGIRTAAPEELREHVERVRVLVLATFVGLQTLFTMSVVNLPFLRSVNTSSSLSRMNHDSLLSRRGSHML